MKKRLLACLLTAAMLVSLFPLPALAAEAEPYTGGLCHHHQEHSYEVCGYVEAVEGQPCGHIHDGSCGYVEAAEEVPCDMDCADTDGDGQIDHAGDCAYTPAVAGAPCQHKHDSECGYMEAVEGRPCGYICHICPVQAMIDALPDPEDITDENRAGVEAQLEAIGEAWNELTDDEALQIDATRLEAAWNALAALDEQNEVDEPAPLTGETGNFTVTGGTWDKDYSYADNTLTIKTSANLTISGTTTDRIVIADGISADVTIDGLNIDTTAGNAIDIGADSTLNLTLNGSNKLCPGGQKAGIHVPENTSLVISGDGSLEVYGGRNVGNGGGAGIGADRSGSLGAITISSGTITATARSGGGAGIGMGGWGGSDSGSSVTITGGYVTASAAAGDEGSFTAASIAITGGIVEVPDNKLDRAEKNNCIVFSNGNGQVYGTFTLTGDFTVESGKSLTVPTGVTLDTTSHTLINNGTITVAGTVSGTINNNDVITVTGTITGTLNNENGIIFNGGTIPENIGGTVIDLSNLPEKVEYIDAQGNTETADNVRSIISGTEKTDWTDGTWYAVYGSVEWNSRVTVQGNVHLILMNYCNFTINGGIRVQGSANSLTIYAQSTDENTMGKLTATDGSFNAGIGGNSFGACSVITINGGNVTATGGAYGAGIGGGQDAGGGTITINGGVVHAIGSGGAAGIGEGGASNVDTTTKITITGGTVTAEGGGRLPGIGGEKKDCQITITGGTVNAIGKDVSGYGNGCGISCKGELNINGNALVYASAGSRPAIHENNKTNSGSWRGIVFEGNNGRAYGDVILTEDVTIPQGNELTIPNGSKLTIPNNVELVLEGSIRVEGQLEVNGNLSGSGTVYPPSDTPISNCTINYFAETATADAGCQVKTDRSDWGSTVQIRPESTLYVRSGSGIAYGFQLPSRPGRPTGLQAMDATSAGNDGRITGVSTAMEYRKNSEGTWTPCTGTEITDLTAGTYLIRYKATEMAFASNEAYVAVRAAAPEQGFCLNEGSIYISDDGNGGIMVEQNGAEYTVSNGEIRITGSGGSTPHTISVDDVTAHITLSNVTQNSGRYSPLGIWSSNVRLTLEGNNTMLTENDAIYAASTSLTIDGPGTLTVGSAEKRACCGIDMGDFGDSNVTVNGGTLNIFASEVAIGSDMMMLHGSDDAPSVTINGGIVNADVNSDYGVGIGMRYAMESGMDIAITGGTVNLTGAGNKISAKGRYPEGSNSGSVTITGGSVTAGEVTPQAANGAGAPVYPVTVSGTSGVVDALAVKGASGAVSYGRPDTAPEGGMTLYLPEGTYSGTAIVGGKLVTFNCEASSGAASPSTATDTGIQITTPVGEKPTIDEDGGVTVPDGSTVQTGDGPEITLPDGGAVKQDGTTTTTGGGKMQIGDTTVTPPSGGTITTDRDGKTDIPQNSTVQTGDSSPEIKLPDGGSMSGGGITLPDGGSVQIGNPATTITPPNGEPVIPSEGGVTVPGGSTVKPGDGGPEITVGDQGGSVGGDGGVTVPGGGKVTVKGNPDDITITLPSGGGTVKPNPDRTIALPGGAKVEQGGQEITVPDGGGTYHPENGTVTKDVCTVTFDSQGGSAVNSATATYGRTVAKPGNPSKSGYTFGGWYKESGCTTAWNFDTDTVTGDITLYAKWTRNSSGGDGGSYTPPTTTYPPTVERPSGGGGTPAVTPSNPKQGDTVTVTPKPNDGYEVDKITVTDRNGRPVEVTKKPDGTYTFKQPSGKVTVEVTYQPIDRPWSNPFADVSEGDWYYEAVRLVQERGLMNGYSDGRFGPNDTLSRAQLAQILFNKEGRPGVNYLMDFSDVAGEAWYTEAIRWATSQGIVGGYGNGTFGPNDPITREQLAVMLWRYSKSPAATNKELHFNDESEISGFALEALRWAVENGILNGYGDGRLGPQGQATRAQVAQMLKNFIENQEEENT